MFDTKVWSVYAGDKESREMLGFETYAENVRMAAMSKDNAQGRPLKIRELASLAGYSYEHIRKLWMGRHDEKQKFSISRDCNGIVCEILGLDEETMWKLAQREKFAQKEGYKPVELEDPQGRELRELWETLTPRQHLTLIEIARSMQLAAAHVAR